MYKIFQNILFISILSINLIVLIATNFALAKELKLESEILSAPCFSCHGSQGVSVGAIPSLAGYDLDTFKKIMNLMSQRGSEFTIMGRIASGYSSKEIERLADYFSSLKSP